MLSNVYSRRPTRSETFTHVLTVSKDTGGSRGAVAFSLHRTRGCYLYSRFGPSFQGPVGSLRKRRDRPYPIQFGIFYAALRATASTVPVDLLSAFRERHRPILRARCQIDAFTQTLHHQKARTREHERRDTVALTTLNFVGSAGRIIVPFLSARPYLSERKMLATSTTRSFGYCYSRYLMRVA